MDTTLSARSSRSWRRIAGYAALALGVGAAGTAFGLFVWARSYSPLSLPAQGYGGDVHVLTDPSGFGSSSDGAAVIGRRPATFELDFVNDGRLPVSITDVEPWPPGPAPRIVVTHVKAIEDGVSPLAQGHPLPGRFSRRRGPRLYVTLQADCGGAPTHTFSTATTLAVRYRYLRLFSKAQLFDTPLPLVVSCP